MVNANDLRWGFQDWSEPVLAAYGARTIFRHGEIDFLPDRQEFLGDNEQKSALRHWINGKALPALRKHIKKQQWTQATEEIFTYENWPYILKASPRGSHGYLYLNACLTGSDEYPTGKWSGKFIPKIKETVIATINGIGRSKVLGYFIENDWIGVIVRPHNPPEWYIRQNGRHALCGLFGAEIQKADKPDSIPQNHAKEARS